MVSHPEVLFQLVRRKLERVLGGGGGEGDGGGRQMGQPAGVWALAPADGQSVRHTVLMHCIPILNSQLYIQGIQTTTKYLGRESSVKNGTETVE